MTNDSLAGRLELMARGNLASDDRTLLLASAAALREVVPIRERLRMAMDSQEFYELSQAYRHIQEWSDTGGMNVNPVVVAWDALKQYVLDNAAPACTAALDSEGSKK